MELHAEESMIQASLGDVAVHNGPHSTAVEVEQTADTRGEAGEFGTQNRETRSVGGEDGGSSPDLLTQAPSPTECPDASAQDDAAVADGDTAACENGATARATGEGGVTTSSTDYSTVSRSDAAEPVAANDETVPQISKLALESLLDESTGELVAPEAFPHEVDDRAFENEWLGRHTDLSLAVFQAELLKTSEHTDDVDENGKLLSDPVKRRLARGRARITLRVHRGLREDQKIDFILRLQARDRDRNHEDNQELKRRLIQRWLLLGLDYKEIAKIAGVHPNTVRNVEKRAAADPNSKLGNTRRSDGRFKPETREKIAEAARLRAEGKSSAEIAEIFDTDQETIGKWLKDPLDGAKTKTKDKGGKKPKTSQGTSAAQLTQATDVITATDGIPKVHRLALKHVGQDDEAYVEWLEAASAKARAAVNAAAGSVEKTLKLFLDASAAAAAAHFGLRQLLTIPSEVTDAETPPRDSFPDAGGCKVGDILHGTVMEIKPDEVIVALLDGSGGIGVIDNRDNCLAGKGPLVQGQSVRIRVEEFESEGGLTNLTLLGRQSLSHSEGANTFGAQLDERCSPDTELAGIKAGPKEKEVIG